MKIFIALLLSVASTLARPEIGIENSREISAQQLLPLTDSSQLPDIIETNDQIRTPKDRQIYFEGAQIPVQLVYESDDHETQAIVKEVSVESLLKKPQGKLLNRVERSEIINSKTESNLDTSIIANEQIRDYTVNAEVTKNEHSNVEASTETNKDEILQITEVGEEEEEAFPINTDELNKGLGIEAKHSNKGIEAFNLQPPQESSMIDHNFNLVKELIKNMNNQGKNNGVRRTIQHYQSLLQPVRATSYLPLSQSYYNNINTVPSHYHPKIIKVTNYYPVVSSVNLLPPTQNMINNKEKISDDYFPIVVNNPLNSMWSTLTNIIEYGPETELCKTEGKIRRKKRELVDDRIVIQQNVLDDLSRQGGFGLARPNIMKLKVRRGGIAIAGPGGIATAGSGGTTIVGPGGTAFTPPDATAVVGPGGRVVHIPSFDSSEIQSRTTDISQYFKNGKVVAHGPVVIYNPPSVVESL